MLKDECILLNSDEDEKDSEEISMIAGTKVLPADFDILKHSSGWLNDRLINAGQSLLKAKFPDTLGLQDVGRAQTCSFAEEEEGEFVQIINCFDDHWVCVTNKNCKQNEVKVYDSMRTGDLCLNGKEAVASLVRTSKKHFFLTFPDVQQQDGGCDCGLYALAFSYSLCAGTDPAKLVYNQTEFRSHFFRCLMKKEVTDFPHDTIMKVPGKSLLRRCKVFCSCRLPDTGDAMVQCSKCLEWYHFTCIGNECQEKPLPELWYCIICS